MLSLFLSSRLPRYNGQTVWQRGLNKRVIVGREKKEEESPHKCCTSTRLHSELNNRRNLNQIKTTAKECDGCYDVAVAAVQRTTECVQAQKKVCRRALTISLRKMSGGDVRAHWKSCLLCLYCVLTPSKLSWLSKTANNKQTNEWRKVLVFTGQKSPTKQTDRHKLSDTWSLPLATLILQAKTNWQAN